MMKTNSVIAIIGLALLGSVAQADIMIFDDAMENGWSKKWNVDIVTDPTDPGNLVLSGSGQTITAPGSAASVGGDYFLEFDINTVDAAQIVFTISMATSTDSLYPFDNRNIPTVYVIDGSDVTYPSGGVLLNTDPNTWQHVKIDLTQTCYTGWPYTAHTFDPATATIDRFYISGNGTLLLDNVALTGVPEPMTMVVMAAGIPLLLRRRRRRG